MFRRTAFALEAAPAHVPPGVAVATPVIAWPSPPPSAPKP